MDREHSFATASDGDVSAIPRPGAEYEHYLKVLRERIQERLTYPSGARRRGLVGTVLLEIIVEPTGVVRRALVVTSSSHTILDDAAVEAVNMVRAVPFPSGVVGRALRVRLPVVFSLDAAR